MANANLRRRDNRSRQNTALAKAMPQGVKDEKDTKSTGKKRRSKPFKNKKCNDNGKNDAESSHVQIVIRNILLASLISTTLIVGSVLVWGKHFVWSSFDLTPLYGASNSKKKEVPPQRVSKAIDYDIIQDETNDWSASDSKLQRVHNFLTNYVCRDADYGQDDELPQYGYCHPLLNPVPRRRTHNVAAIKSNHSIGFREVVMTLPRHLLIWDLDAMRDAFVRRELFGARHEGTGNTIDCGAFLAAYLVRKLLIGRGQWDDHSKNNLDLDENARLMEYLQLLPSYQDFEQTHPTLWPMDELENQLGRMTLSFNLVMGYKNMMISEYNAFCKASEEFKENVGVEEYISMRLNVISRSFGPGPPGPEEEIVGIHGVKTLKEEFQLYKDETGVDFQKGCRAMSPILDMWDHHAKPNVEWRYSSKKRAFIILAVGKKGIPAMQDIMVSYGKYTDTHLFAKFGFTNGDGSGYTEASIAVMHPLLDLGMGSQFSNLIDKDGKTVPSEEDQEAQRQTLVNYLRYDDGYDNCISKENNPEGYKLKLLKLRHLQKIANKYDRWTFSISPRDVESNPSISSNVPITTGAPVFDPKNVKFNGSKIIATCRLIALNVDDYDGNAIEVLENALKKDDFIINKKQSDALEFRSLTVLSRLVTGALSRYPSTVKKDIVSLSSSALKFQSKEWTAAHTRMGEMQSLEALRSIAVSGAKQMKASAQRELSSSHPSLNIHRSTCPRETAVELLKETLFKL
jgi:hypothetical protein